MLVEEKVRAGWSTREWDEGGKKKQPWEIKGGQGKMARPGGSS